MAKIEPLPDDSGPLTRSTAQEMKDDWEDQHLVRARATTREPPRPRSPRQRVAHGVCGRECGPISSFSSGCRSRTMCSWSQQPLPHTADLVKLARGPHTEQLPDSFLPVYTTDDPAQSAVKDEQTMGSKELKLYMRQSKVSVKVYRRVLAAYERRHPGRRQRAADQFWSSCPHNRSHHTTIALASTCKLWNVV